MNKYKCSYCGVDEDSSSIFETIVSSIYVCEKDECRLQLVEECIEGEIKAEDYNETY